MKKRRFPKIWQKRRLSSYKICRSQAIREIKDLLLKPKKCDRRALKVVLQNVLIKSHK